MTNAPTPDRGTPASAGPGPTARPTTKPDVRPAGDGVTFRSAPAARVEVARQDTVAIVTLRNEAGMNSFDPVYLREVRACIEAQIDDPAVRAVVLTGSGKAFSTGADVKAMGAAAQAGTASQWVLDATAELHPLMEKMATSDTVFVAAVNGVAAGGGLGLALAADARVGCDASRFAAGYFGIGLSPDGGATWFLPRLIGWQRTRRFFFDNEVMSAESAIDCGLLDVIVQAKDVVPTAVALAARWGASSVASRGGTKRLLAQTHATGLTDQLAAERKRIAAAAGSPDFVEGTTAFAEKRAARFG